MWKFPASAATARSMASSAFLTRVNGRTGIICSVQMSGCSLGTSTRTVRTWAPPVMPSSRRITEASFLMYFLLTTAWPARARPFSKITFSRRGRSAAGSSEGSGFIAPFSASAIESTAMTPSSSVQMTLLSKECPKTTSRPAFSMSAVWSTMAAGCRVRRRWPLPVHGGGHDGAASRHDQQRTRGCFIRRLADSDGRLGRAGDRVGRPPAFTIAAPSSRTVSAETRLAEGCGLNTTVFPAATMPMELQMIVEEGLVDRRDRPDDAERSGLDQGEAVVPEVPSASALRARRLVGDEQVLHLVLDAAEARLSTAMAASGRAFCRMASRMDSMSSCRLLRPRASRALRATEDAATASSRLENTHRRDSGPAPGEPGPPPPPSRGR